jgi:hypothetical protein
MARIGVKSQEWNFRISREALWSAATWRRVTSAQTRAELRQRGLPMIIWRDGKVLEVPALFL